MHFFADYNAIDDNFFVGSCPKDGDDIDTLFKDESVTAILNLQQEKDFQKHNVNIASIKAACSKSRILFFRVPVCFRNRRHQMYEVDVLAWLERSSCLMDFFFVGFGNWACGIGCQIYDGDPGDLTQHLPEAVGTLDKAISTDKKKVYLHCSAGVARSPSVAVAYYYWIKGMDVSFWFSTSFACSSRMSLFCWSLYLGDTITDSVTSLHVIYLWDPWSRLKCLLPQGRGCIL